MKQTTAQIKPNAELTLANEAQFEQLRIKGVCEERVFQSLQPEKGGMNSSRCEINVLTAYVNISLSFAPHSLLSPRYSKAL